MTAPQLSPGQTVAGKYSIQATLGFAGSTATYHATDAQGQQFALKLYAPAIAQHQNVMQGLETAYATTNALPANSVAPIVDAGYDPQTGAPYSATGLIQLPNLKTSSRRLTTEEVSNLLHGLAKSIDLAHVRGVVHGALKPTNIFVGPSQNPVVVTDFAANLAKGAMPTQEGFALSAPWIAPEQAQGGSAVGPACDVFTAALVAFFALTGRSFWRSCLTDTPDVALWQQELTGERTPISARAAELGVPVSPTIDSVMWKALSVDPNARFHSIGELAAKFADAAARAGAAPATMALPALQEMAPAPPPAPMPAAQPDPGYPPAPAPAVAAPHPPPAQQKKSGILIPILIAVTMVGIGGLAAVWAATSGDDDEPTGPIAVDPSTTVTEAPPPDEEPPEAPVVVEDEPTDSLMSIGCKPACGMVTLNDEEVDVSKKVRLEPGEYTIKIVTKGFRTITEDIEMTAGKDFEKTYALKPKFTGPLRPPKPDCGKFLKRCD